jgi:16S rRNA processing protein RimM
VRGELKLLPSGIGEDAVRKGTPVTLRFGDQRDERDTKITQARRHKRLMIVRLSEVVSANEAETLVGADVWTSRDNAALSDDEFFDQDLIGCVLRDGDRTVGTVRNVLHYPAQDVLELDGGALVPLVRAFVREIDVAGRVIRVDLPPGLVDGEAL